MEKAPSNESAFSEMYSNGMKQEKQGLGFTPVNFTILLKHGFRCTLGKFSRKV